MLRKTIAALSLAVFAAYPILAQERTFVTNPPTTSGAGVTYNSGTNTVTATAADGARLFSVTRPIERGAKYTYEFTVSGYSAGGVQPYVGTIRDTYVAPTITAPVSAAANPASPGEVPIADNFTTANGLVAQTISPSTDGTEGAFRIFCRTSHVRSDDPLIVPNVPGASHMHNFFGNTGTNAYSTYRSLRTSGGSSCGLAGQNQFPLNRSAYWFPAMLNGNGGVVTAGSINMYYKRSPLTGVECQDGPNKLGICIRVPHGLTMIWGYNMSTMAPGEKTFWACRARPGTSGTDGGDNTSESRGASINPVGGGPELRFATLKALRDASGGCPIGNAAIVNTEAPACWNGTQLRSPNHRDHVAQIFRDGGNIPRCPGTHPYHFPQLSHLISWDVDANFANWRLASDDQMGMGVDAGSTFHTDVMFAWSPTFINTWQDNCIDGARSCSAGNAGNTTGLDQGLVNQFRSRILPANRQGFGLIRRKNGTFRGEFTAPADGEFGLSFLLFTGNVTGFKVTKITKGARGPVTQAVTQ